LIISMEKETKKFIAIEKTEFQKESADYAGSF
jgi:hypothetical protein